MKIVAYYRVSTQRQGRSGLGLDAQRSAVQSFMTDQHKLMGEYTEIESGRNCDREQLRRAVDHARAAGAMLVVAKLDRLARDAKFLLNLIDTGITIRFLDLPDLSGDAITSRLVLTVMAAIAEFEAKRISQRCRDAMDAAKRRGKVFGWQTTKKKKCPLTKKHRLVGAKLGKIAYLRVTKLHRDSVRQAVFEAIRDRTLSQAAEHLNGQGYLTYRGRPWSPANLHRLLKYMGKEAG